MVRLRRPKRSVCIICGFTMVLACVLAQIDEPPTPYHAPVELADSDSESSRRGEHMAVGLISNSGPFHVSGGRSAVASTTISVLKAALLRGPAGSVGSGAGTPNAKKGGPGYLAEHWETLTSALEAAASNQNGSTGEARGSLDESSSSHASCQGGGGSLSSTTSNRRASFSSEDPTCSVKPKTPVEQKKFQAKRLSHYDEYKKLQVRGVGGRCQQAGPCIHRDAVFI